MEYALVCRWGDFRAGQRVLDIGSPKLLSLYLAGEVGAQVVATDIDPYFVDDCVRLARAAGLASDRFAPEIEDGRDLSFPDASFDRVYSISVVEHITDDGDARCLEEIGRVLKPGGRALITVPFAPRARDVYRPADYVYWTRGQGTDGQEEVFFERRYSEDGLRQRLIGPSGLSVRTLQFVGERIAGRGDRDIWERIPWALGPVHPLISVLLHDGPAGSWREVRNPALAFIALEKERDGLRVAAPREAAEHGD